MKPRRRSHTSLGVAAFVALVAVAVIAFVTTSPLASAAAPSHSAPRAFRNAPTPTTAGTVPAPNPSPAAVQTFSEILGHATVDDVVHVHHRAPTEVVVQRLTVAPGDSSGWHSHPGPHVVLVVSGYSTVYQTNCTHHTYGPGEAFVVPAGHVHLARNEGTTAQVQLVVHFVDPDANLFIPQPAPRGCDVR